MLSLDSPVARSVQWTAPQLEGRVMIKVSFSRWKGFRFWVVFHCQLKYRFSIPMVINPINSDDTKSFSSWEPGGFGWWAGAVHWWLSFCVWDSDHFRGGSESLSISRNELFTRASFFAAEEIVFVRVTLSLELEYTLVSKVQSSTWRMSHLYQYFVFWYLYRNSWKFPSMFQVI